MIMSAELSKTPMDRVCAECDAILTWRGTPTRGQYRHSRPGGELYITTHAPAPRASLDDTPPQSGYTPCACRDCMDTAVSSKYPAPLALCAECEEAGCLNYSSRANLDYEGGSEFECQRDDAYGEA